MRHAFGRISGALLVAFGAISPVHAHPGHSPTGAPLPPTLLGPDHLGTVLIAAVIFFYFARALRWRERPQSRIS